MRKNQFLFVLVIVFLLWTSDLSKAQLSGVYTIDQTSLVSTSNFTSITSFANYLNINGVTGAVTVNIVANTGPYIEQPSFTPATGVSNSNSILINGNNNTITASSINSSQPWVLNLNGADYMTFKNLNIIGAGSYAYGVVLNGGADFNNFDSLHVTVPANSNSTNYIPFVFSGSNTSHTVTGNGGSANRISNSTLTNGYYGVILNGNSNTACSSNSIINCSINNYYYNGVYGAYQSFLNIKGCTIERPGSSVAGTSFGIYLYYNQSAIIDANRLRYLGGSVISNTASVYGVYCYYNSSESTSITTGQNVVRNNIVSDIYSNAGIYAYYGYRMGGSMYHNTLVLNNTSYNNNLTTVMGFYAWYSSSSPFNFKNNIIYMTMGGNAIKYPVYFNSGNNNSTAGFSSDYNCYYTNNTGTTNYAINGTLTTGSSLAAIQSAGYELNSISLNPQFLGSSNNNQYMPTNPNFDNKGINVGITNDINNQVRAIIPDIGAIETPSNICTNSLTAYSVLTPTYLLCPGSTVSLPFSATYTSSGLTFNWQSSTTSSLGPWTAISGATNQAFTTGGLNQNTWYRAIVICSVSANSLTVNPGLVLIAGNTTSTVPYYEDFEGISYYNQLPNCSWVASSQGSNCLTYTTSQSNNRIPHNGSRFASFYYNPGGQHYFYTNGIFLNPGITYSASVWYTTEQNGYTNFTDLSLLYGLSQSTTGQITIASTNGPAASPVYTSLSNTFQVTASGIYYVALRATVNTTALAQYLSFDDLSIIIPCQLNAPILSVLASTNQVCFGQSVTFTANGATSYNWGNLGVGPILSYTPSANSTITLVGTTAYGCSSNTMVSIQVLPNPTITTSTSGQTLCSGQSITLTASGAVNYSWTSSLNQLQGGQIILTPSSNISYTVIGKDNNGCSSNSILSINVYPASTIAVSASSQTLCAGQSISLTAFGAVNYTWTSSTHQFQSAQVIFSPTSGITFTISGLDTNNCMSKSTLSLQVKECLGIGEYSLSNGIKISPNPNNGKFSIEMHEIRSHEIEITDISGHILFNFKIDEQKTDLNLQGLKPGIYFINIINRHGKSTVKFIIE